MSTIEEMPPLETTEPPKKREIKKEPIFDHSKWKEKMKKSIQETSFERRSVIAEKDPQFAAEVDRTKKTINEMQKRVDRLKVEALRAEKEGRQFDASRLQSEIGENKEAARKLIEQAFKKMKEADEKLRSREEAKK